MVNFRTIRACELVHYVGERTNTTFLFDEKELDFDLSFTLHKPVTKEELLSALLGLLKTHRFAIKQEGPCYLIHPIHIGDEGKNEDPHLKTFFSTEDHFSVYKLQYHSGEEIVESIQKIGGTSKNPLLADIIQTMQWVKASNSLLFSGSKEQICQMEKLISSLDQPLGQVFIEVLVVATDTKESLEFGLEWSAQASASNHSSSASSQNGSSGSCRPFNLSVIGDLIFYKGKGFLSISSLISALEQDRKSSIVLNQKILSQDHKHSKIFVGDNLPFAGSFVQTIGSSQQTTSNIEYRDVGVLLEITPLIGKNGIVTLQIKQEISEASPHYVQCASELGGIQTTKTNMATSVHVPDRHFLALSGMMRNSKHSQKRGIPCLGWIPWIGSLFSKEENSSEYRNILIFVCPHIINTLDSGEKVAVSGDNQLFFHEDKLLEQ